MFPWWPEIGLTGEEEGIYHASTRLLDGRHGLLVDPGAWSNLVGERWAQEVAAKAMSSGHTPSQKKMNQPFTVQGVGKGTNEAKWEVHLPIAINDDDGNTRLHEYRAPTVGGKGKELPALLGLESMSKQKAVLEMTEGSEYLTFPGEGGYKIEWSPGTKRYKLERPPSGHLILPCDAFNELTVQKGGVPTPVTTWHTNQEPATSSRPLPTVEENPRQSAL